MNTFLDAEDLEDPHVLASLEGLELRFPSAESYEMAVSILERYSEECMADSACIRTEARSLRWSERNLFARAVDELDDSNFQVRFPKAERLAWIASLPAQPYAAKLYRGERELRPSGFASDPVDLGTGRYLTTCPMTAAHYGPVGEHVVSYAKAVVIESKHVTPMIDLFYRTCRGNDRVGGADLMRADFLEAGIEAMIAHGYDSPKGHVTVVEYTSNPPRATVAWEELDLPEAEFALARL